MATTQRRIEIGRMAREIADCLDDLFSGSVSNDMDNARTKAKRDGHKYRVIDRETLRAGLLSLAKMEREA